MNADKFSKSIDDEQLDEVAGGTRAEIQKDIKFLNAIGAKLNKNVDAGQVDDAWLAVDVYAHTILDADKSATNEYYKYDEDDEDGMGPAISRQDAMIEAMRKTGKFVDLDKYL